jgi:hypothetical protein
MQKTEIVCGNCNSEYDIKHDEDEIPKFCVMCGEIMELGEMCENGYDE